MANETKIYSTVDQVDIERLKELVKANVYGTTDVVHITTWAGAIYLCPLGFKGEPQGIVEFTAFVGKLVFHNYTPISGIASSLLLKKYEDVAELMNAPVVERED